MSGSELFCPGADIDGKVREALAAALWQGAPMSERPTNDEVEALLAGQDWTEAEQGLDAQGWAALPGLLTREQCADAAALWDREQGFRSRVTMARHGFGEGEYRYFAYPLPSLFARLRELLYERLAPTANRWADALGSDARYPDRHAEYLARCHWAGQTRPTPLILRYEAGGWNALHQDLYGPNVFPIQAAILLSRPGEDFGGGEFLLTEQRPRMQSRGTVVPLGQGDAVLFAVNHRPVRGTRGWYRTAMRHGVSIIRSGERRTLGIIFHDAA